MAETLFQSLSADDRRYALRVAQEEGKHRAYLIDEDEPFDALMERCAAIEARANGSAG